MIKLCSLAKAIKEPVNVKIPISALRAVLNEFAVKIRAEHVAIKNADNPPSPLKAAIV